MDYNKYSESKIYKLCNTVDDLFYVGSTTYNLAKRFTDHKAISKRRPNTALYLHLNNIGWDKVKIELICNFNCETKEELHKEEDRFIVLLKPTLNMRRAVRSMKQYAIENKDQIEVYRKQWVIDNKEALKAQRMKKVMCKICNKEYTHANVLRHNNSKYHIIFL